MSRKWQRAHNSKQDERTQETSNTKVRNVTKKSQIKTQWRNMYKQNTQQKRGHGAGGEKYPESITP